MKAFALLREEGQCRSFYLNGRAVFAWKSNESVLSVRNMKKFRTKKINIVPVLFVLLSLS